MKRDYKCYCDTIENVENYEKALEDDFKGWHCHHRLETHTSDGERRLVDISMDELVALDMYYHRPASELIFMTTLEHKRLHLKGKPHSEEMRKKMSEAMKGKPSPRKGKHLSEEHKRKIGEANKGKKLGPMTEETKAKMSKSRKGLYKGKHWKLVDGKRVWY